MKDTDAKVFVMEKRPSPGAGLDDCVQAVSLRTAISRLRSGEVDAILFDRSLIDDGHLFSQKRRNTIGRESNMTDSPEYQEESPSYEASQSGRADESLRILLVEDSAVNQRVATLQIRKLGHRVDLAANGKEAVEAVASADYDMVFMDCQMPEMNGYDATAEIRRSQGRSKRTPIIAMTAGSMARDKVICIQAGMDDYISKPFSTKALAELIERWREARPDLGMVSEVRLAKEGA